MADLDKPELVLELENTGERYRVEEYRIDADYLQNADAWSVTIYNRSDPASLRRKLRPLQPIKLYLDGQPQIVGRIDRTQCAGDAGTALQVEGRDYVGDIVDGCADPVLTFKEGMSLRDALLEILKPYGIVKLHGDFALQRNLITGKDIKTGISTKDFGAAKLSDFKIEWQEGAFEAANKIVVRHGFTIQPTMDRASLAVCEPQYGQSSIFLLRRPGNALRAAASRDYGNIPTVTIAKARATSGLSASPLTGAKGEYPTFGEGSPNELGRLDEVKRVIYGDGSDVAAVFHRFSPPTDGIPGNNGLRYTPLFYEDKKSRSVEEVERGIRKVIGDRAKGALVYTATVRGHRDTETKAIYCVDTIGTVQDEIADVRQDMWVQSRTLENTGGGPMTHLTLTLPGAVAL